MDDLICVKTYTVTVSLPTVIEKKGKRIAIDDDEVQTAAEQFSEELDELNFAELMTAMGQKVAEEQFLRFRPHVDVSVGA